MMQGSGGLTVTSGFRFHPTDEELLYFYLRRKVSYEKLISIDMSLGISKVFIWTGCNSTIMASNNGTDSPIAQR
ncbi:hypothetical protein P8452_10086 [Trifolium repens]|nr:hypothetical protein P8452_01068 [Trifolium repens]WJX20545.1 hypothetical protein P8452_10086 [Trifolium repens]